MGAFLQTLEPIFFFMHRNDCPDFGRRGEKGDDVWKNAAVSAGLRAGLRKNEALRRTRMLPLPK